MTSNWSSRAYEKSTGDDKNKRLARSEREIDNEPNDTWQFPKKVGRVVLKVERKHG